MSLSVVTFPEALHIVGRLFNSDQPETLVRDSALLPSALDRQSASKFAHEAYPGIHHKAAALLSQLICSGPVVRRRKRL